MFSFSVYDQLRMIKSISFLIQEMGFQNEVKVDNFFILGEKNQGKRRLREYSYRMEKRLEIIGL
jgi:hypothetical protein